MADSSDQSDMAPDSGQYDNDFEKLSHNGGDDEIVSSTLPGGKEQTVDDDEVHGTDASRKSEISALAESATGGVKASGCPFARFACSSSSAGSSTCCMKNLDPRVIDLILWRDIRKTGIVFGTSVVVLTALSLCSILSVMSYLSLTLLTITFTFRCYWHAMCSVKKMPEESPFKKYLDIEFSISDDTAHHYADIIAKHLTKVAEDLRRLFLVENVIDTLKFGLVLWVLTYIGHWFNGITLLIIADVLLFTVPKLYNMYKTEIDNCAEKVCATARQTWKSVQDKIPVLSKKKQA